MIRPLLILLVLTAAFCGATAELAYLIFERQRDVAFGYSFAAFALCCVPAMGTTIWIAVTAPDQRLVAGLGSIGVRMMFVLGAGWLLNTQVEFFHRKSFWIWLLMVYLFVLALEVILLAGRKELKG